MSNITSTLTLALKDDGLQAKARADAEALKKLGASGADLKKLAASNPHIEKLTKGLDSLAAQGAKLDAFRAGSKSLKDFGASMRQARVVTVREAAALAKAQATGDAKATRIAERTLVSAKKRQDALTSAFVDQGRAVREARKALVADGIVGQSGRGLGIAAAEKRIAGQVAATNDALRDRIRLVQQAPRPDSSGSEGTAPGGAGRKPGRGAKPKPGESHAGGGHGGVSAAGLLGTHEAMRLGAGFTAYEAVHEAYKAQTHRQHEEVRDRASGMSEHEVAEGSHRAGELSGKYRAFSQTEIMHSLRNARSIMGNFEEAQQVMEPMLKLRTVALGAHPEKRDELEVDFDKLIKGMEIKGVTQDMGKFTQYMDGMAKALNVFGDTLKPTDYYEMFKYGRQATQGLSQDYMNTVAPTIAQELGGSSGGVAHAAFFRAIVGGKMANNATEALKDIGLLNDDDLIKTKTGAVKGIKPGHRVKGADEAQANPYEWVQNYLIPALEKHGITSPERVQETIGHIFSNQVAAQLVSLFATQQSRIEKDKHLVQGAGGLDEASRFQHEDPMVAWQSVKAQAENAFAAIGGFGAAAASLNKASEFLAHMAETWGRQNEANEKGDKDALKDDRSLAPESISKLNDLLGTPTYDVQGLSDPNVAAARRAKLERDSIDQRKDALDAEAAKHRDHIARLDGVDAAGGLGATFGRGTREAERGRARAAIASLEAQKQAIDAAVAARDKALSDYQDGKAAQDAVAGLRFGKHNTGSGIGGTTADWGLHGAAGMDQPSPWDRVQKAVSGPVNAPLPPRRPAEFGAGAGQQLKDIKDVLGGGSDGFSPIIVPKVDTSQVEAAKPKVEEVKTAVEGLNGVTGKPNVDTSSIAEGLSLVRQLASAIGALGPAAAGAKAQLASIPAPSAGGGGKQASNRGWAGGVDYTT